MKLFLELFCTLPVGDAITATKKEYIEMAKTVKEKYPEVKEIKHGIGTAKEGAVELAKHVKDDSVQQIEQTAQTIKNQYQTEMERVETHVRTNPLQSVAVAFAGGLLASMILRGRR